MVKGIGSIAGWWLVLAGCASPRPDAAAPNAESVPSSVSGSADPGPRPPAGEPRFVWPLQRAVPVEERSNKNGRRSVKRYFVQLCSVSEGRFRVETKKFELIEINGVLATDPRIAGAVASMSPVMGAIPAILVDARGNAVGVQGWDEMLDALSIALPAAKVEEMRRLFAAEKARALVEEAAYGRWRTWVENWLAYDPELGPNIEITTHFRGTPQEHRLSFVGWSGPRAQLLLETRLSREGLISFLDSLTAAADSPKLDQSALQHASVTRKAQVESDWPEIRPHFARSEQEVSIVVGGRAQQSSEVLEFRFDWANTEAASCGLPSAASTAPSTSTVEAPPP